MLFWLLAVTALYYVQMFLPAIFKLFTLGLGGYLGSRDNEPVLTGMPGRIDRAARNMRENFPVFTALAVALLALDMGNAAQAIFGAQVFAFSRALYIPLYAMAVPLVRSLAAVGGWAGLIVMAAALVSNGAA